MQKNATLILYRLVENVSVTMQSITSLANMCFKHNEINKI